MKWELQTEDGRPVSLTETVTSFRGEKAQLLSFTPPWHSASTGRVEVTWEDGKCPQEYFPSVFGLKIVQVQD